MDGDLEQELHGEPRVVRHDGLVDPVLLRQREHLQCIIGDLIFVGVFWLGIFEFVTQQFCYIL